MQRDAMTRGDTEAAAEPKPAASAMHAFSLHPFLEVSAQGLDDQSRIFEQLNHYTLCYPEVLQEKPYWCGLLLRDHRNPAVREMCELWFAHVQRYSRRDQLSFNFVLRRSGLQPDVLPIDNHRSSYHSWPHKTPAHQPTRMHRPVAAYGTLSARIRELEMNLASEKQRADAQLAQLLADKQQSDAHIRSLSEANEAAARRARELEARIGELESALPAERQQI
jgi:hypothetical protein